MIFNVVHFSLPLTYGTEAAPSLPGLQKPRLFSKTLVAWLPVDSGLGTSPSSYLGPNNSSGGFTWFYFLR